MLLRQIEQRHRNSVMDNKVIPNCSTEYINRHSPLSTLLCHYSLRRQYELDMDSNKLSSKHILSIATIIYMLEILIDNIFRMLNERLLQLTFAIPNRLFV
jgi:hypothetical protein